MTIVNYLVVITSMEVEEGYFFGLMALAIALILFSFRQSIAWTVAIGVALALIFLSKSSMLPAVAVLLVAALLKTPAWKLRGIMVLIVCLAPVSWAVYQHHESGRYSIGTSLDGLNLHKGNNAEFQERYPSPNSYLDSFDSELNKGHYFTNEWSFNDYHMAEGRLFALSHREFTTLSAEKKLNLLLFSLSRYNVTQLSRTATLVTDLGMFCFRLLLWTSLLLALHGVITGRGIGRFSALTYLAFVAAYCLPYVVGFGYTRHAIVLAYPAAILCCLAVRNGRKGHGQAY
jgi:hypothetical protein